MSRSVSKALLWTLAVLITLASAVYQRLSGPTYPVRVSVTLGGDQHRLRLTRSHEGATDQPIRLQIADPAVAGEVKWRRYPTADAWQTIVLRRSGDWLEAALPNQPAAGKLEYQVRLQKGHDRAIVPERPAITRFKGVVSPYVLGPHILAMFLSMLIGTRAGLAALAGHDAKRFTYHAFGLLILGGFVLGPAVQKQAFDEWWAGVPYGWDLTDNKTLVAGLAWAWAVWALARRQASARLAVAVAAFATLVVFMIPHSVWGSEITWDSAGPAGPAAPAEGPGAS